MVHRVFGRWLAGVAVLGAGVTLPLAAQGAVKTPNPTPPGVRAGDAVAPVTKDDLLRGAYGPYRANNDLLYYRLRVRVDPEAKSVTGSNLIRFRMVEDGEKIQLELTQQLAVDAVTFAGKPAGYTREERTLWVTLPRMLKRGEVGEVMVAYSGKPMTQGRFGCFRFDKDTAGKPWITTACEEEGASVWWPNKDQWRDEPQDGMEIDVAVPNGLTDVSNGRFVASKDLGDGYTEWQWRVHYPINNYDVSLNIGDYKHFTLPQHGRTTLDFYALPADLDKAKEQFKQVPEMLDAYEHFFGEYPFVEDGYKLIQVPYTGMEHQSAVTYGNHFKNGYYERDWTGVGISPRFDFIIIHESGHEWFGNAVTAADPCDMWIHEGWTTYMESLYVEYRWGKADAIKYLNGLKKKVHNERPIIPACGVNLEPPEDQYFKGALMLNTLRSVIDDDARWFADLHDFYQHFKYQQISTADVVQWWSAKTGRDLKPFFDEYLRHAKLPELELNYDAEYKTMRGSWKADAAGFEIPIRVGDAAHWTVVAPSKGEDFRVKWEGSPESFKVATDLYYIDVERQQAP